jgi:molybdate transport system regulatory protein
MAIWLYLRLEFARHAAIGPARSAVLEAIEKCGSITEAATAVGLTYRQTWSQVQEINKQFGEIIIAKRGRHAGGASLTPAGAQLLARYRDIERRFYKTFAKDLKFLEQLVEKDPNSLPVVPRWAQVIVPEQSAKPRPVKKRKARAGSKSSITKPSVSRQHA